LNYRDLSLALFEPLWTLLDLGPLSFRVHRFRSSVGFYHSIELLPKSPPSDRSAKKPSAARSMSALPWIRQSSFVAAAHICGNRSGYCCTSR